MTDGTKELDEILEKVRYAAYYADYHANHTQEHINSIIAEHVAEQKQAILDWHNKQIEEVLDRLEQVHRANPLWVGMTQRVIPLSAIEAERNKLKED